jgi:hypothetical protein
MLLPPMPSSGLRMTSPSSSMKAWMSAGSRAISVVGVNCGNSVMATFSEWSRIARGLFQMRAPSAFGALQQPGGGDVFEIEGRVLAHQHRVVGGQRQHGFFRPGRYQAYRRRRQKALRARRDAPSRQVSAARWMAQTSWPRFAAARIMAMTGILVGLEALERVENESQLHGLLPRRRALEFERGRQQASRATTP